MKTQRSLEGRKEGGREGEREGGRKEGRNKFILKKREKLEIQVLYEIFGFLRIPTNPLTVGDNCVIHGNQRGPTPKPRVSERLEIQT